MADPIIIRVIAPDEPTIIRVIGADDTPEVVRVNVAGAPGPPGPPGPPGENTSSVDDGFF